MKKLIIAQICLLSLISQIASADDLAKGQEIYKSTCITCHGGDYDGMGDAGKYMNPKPRNLKSDKFTNGDSAAQIFKTITEGFKEGSTGMVSFSKTLSETDRQAVAAFVVSLRKK